MHSTLRIRLTFWVRRPAQDRVGLAGGVPSAEAGSAGLTAYSGTSPRSCARDPQEVEVLHPVNLSQIFFQPAVVDPEDRQLHHWQNWLGAGGWVLGGWLLVVEVPLHFCPREMFGRSSVVGDDSLHGGSTTQDRKPTAF